MDKRMFRTLLILSLLSLAGVLIALPSMPELVPTHWNLAGEIDGWGSKYTWLGLSAMPAAITLGLHFLPRVDPKRAGHEATKAYNIISAVTVVVLIALSWVTVLPSLGIALPVDKAIIALIGVMLIGMGNYMPQVRPNFFMGFKTPWALSNDTVWRKTHRAGGILFCICGSLMVLGIFLLSDFFMWLTMGLLLLGTVGVYVYSYVVYKRLAK